MTALLVTPMSAVGGGSEQRRLPDPGLAADYQRAVDPLGKAADELGHDLKFVLSSVQPVARRTGRHEARACRRRRVGRDARN
jgi:hypothetical protein